MSRRVSTPPSRPLTTSKHWPRVGIKGFLVIGAVLSGIGLRAWILLSSQGTLDSDEAVWGLMARHFQHGELSTFYWSQSYGGTLESLLTVPIFWIFGASVSTLRVVPVVLWTAAAVLVWLIGRRLVGSTRGLVAGLLFWTWSPYFIWKSTRAHGFYGSGLVLSLAAVWLAVRLADRASRIDYVLLGLALGLGWWTTPQTAILGLPAVLWLVWKRHAALHGAALAAPAFVLGSLPWWIYNVRHDWASLRPSVDATSKIAHLHNLVSTTLPSALGLRLPSSLAWQPTVAVAVPLYGAALVGLAYLLWRRPSSLALPLTAVVLFPVIYTVSSYTWLNTEPRYLTFIYPMIVLLVAYAATTRLRIATIMAVTLALAAGGIAEMQHHNLTAQHADGSAVPGNFGPLLHSLEERGIRRVYANYWVANRITFESREHIIAATVADHQEYIVRARRVVPTPTPTGSEGRYRKFDRQVYASRGAALVFVANGHREPSAAPLLIEHHYRPFRVGGFEVFQAPS